MGIKTQAATEYLMIVGFVMIILVPSIYLYSKYSAESQDSIANAKVDAIANEIIKATDQVYSYGEGSQTTVSVSFPKNVIGITFGGDEEEQNKEIVFRIINSKGGESDIAKVANVYLTGDITVFPGLKKIIVKSLGSAVSVYVSCNEGDDRDGTEWECNSYIENYEGGGCTMTCNENNRWEIVDD